MQVQKPPKLPSEYKPSHEENPPKSKLRAEIQNELLNLFNTSKYVNANKMEKLSVWY